MNWYKIAKNDLDTDQTGTLAIFRHNNGHTEVLIEKRKNNPYAGNWGLPGGHIQEGEDVVDGTLREIFEETNIQKEAPVFITKRQRDPQKNLKTDDYLFASFLPPNAKIKAGDDAKDLKWINVSNIPPLAFEDDKYILIALAKIMEESIEENIEAISKKRIITASTENDDKEPEVISNTVKRMVNGILEKPEPVTAGLLIVVEGCDGVGKSTAIEKLSKWLEEQSYNIEQTKWLSSKILKESVKKAKKDRLLSPMLYCLLHASDMILRYEQDIIPALKKNKIVLCDRYIYTSQVRDEIRGVNTKILKDIYADFRKPDIIFHCVAPIEVAFLRLLNGKGLSYYGSGSDLNLAHGREENCLKYEKLMDTEYKKIFKNMPNCYKIDMNRSPGKIFKEIKEIIADQFSIGKYKNDA